MAAYGSVSMAARLAQPHTCRYLFVRRDFLMEILDPCLHTPLLTCLRTERGRSYCSSAAPFRDRLLDETFAKVR